MHGGMKNRVKRSVCVHDDYLHRNKFNREIKRIQTRMSELSTTFGDYSIASTSQGQGASGSSYGQIEQSWELLRLKALPKGDYLGIGYLGLKYDLFKDDAMIIEWSNHYGRLLSGVIEEAVNYSGCQSLNS
ncbi:hypothetical protein POM88_019669 [Heracleum sosnowskyi]|uniref:Uncharacterized protein n=1 Tax=Heracleum sosnowskyi TaxID=360622 RepID=A0AAD8MRC3_9APIA|nr:hypothetical protein POM88_019669 [Heracleum sosnowskyi]